MKPLFLTITFIALYNLSCSSQSTPSHASTDRIVGGGCEGCDLIYQGMPPSLQWETTIPPAGEPGEPLILSGTIYKKGGQTPAPGIIFYVYHTDNQGKYSPSNTQTSARRHGHLRGWIKSDAQGRYQFNTIKPRPYPNGKIPAHVHPIVKEPGLTEYYIDEYLFDDDPFLSAEERARQENRGGSGIIKLTKNQKGQWTGHRDIVLGRNIPGY